MPNELRDPLWSVTSEEYLRWLQQRAEGYYWNRVNEYSYGTPLPTSSGIQARVYAEQQRAQTEHWRYLQPNYHRNTASAELPPWGPAPPVPARPASIEKRPVRNITPSGLFEDLTRLSAEEPDTLGT